jgi:protein SCO1/2
MMILFITVISTACNSTNKAELPVYGEIPVFSLTDQNGQTFATDDMHDMVILANFIFTNCTAFCPTLTPQMAQIQVALKERGFLGTTVILLSFSVDPEHDTPDILLSYAEQHGVNHSAWRFLTGQTETLKQIITDGLKLGYGQINESNKHRHEDGSVHIHEYDVFHTNRVILGDKDGRVRAYYNGGTDWDTTKILSDIEQLLAKQ